MLRNSFWRSFLNRRINSRHCGVFLTFFNPLPNPLNPARISSAIRLMVGGPPTITLLGMARLNVSGSVSESGFGLLRRFRRNGGTIPRMLQLSTGMPMRENGSPSTATVLLPINSSSSICGPPGARSGGTHTPPTGICTAIPPVPALARLMLLTCTVVPSSGR